MTAEIAAPPMATRAPDRRRRRKIALLLALTGALIALLGLVVWYLVFRQPIPIPVIPPSVVPAYTTSVYGATSPAGVAVTRDGGRIYVAETGGERVVRIFDGSGSQVGVARPPVETGVDHVPVYLALDPATGELYVSDRPAGTIWVYAADGAFLREFVPAQPIVGWQPLGIAFDPAGNLYVTELRGPGQRVLVFDRQGALVRTIGADLGMNYPNGVALDAAGNVWITDSNNGRLLVIDPGDEVVGRIGRGAAVGNLGLPRGVAIDGAGRAFVVDSTGQGVQVYGVPSDGGDQPQYLGFFGSQGVSDAQFGFPIGVATDDRGRVYVADTANNRVQIWSY